MTQAIRDVCELVASIKLSDIPDEVRQQSRYCILDNLGCAILGADDESSKVIAKTRSPMGKGDEATVVRQSGRDSVFNAAMINASYIHSTDLSEGIARGVVHPGTVVVPAAFAEAEFVKASGADAELAVILGYEVLIRMGWALGHRAEDPVELGNPQLLYRGWFPPAMLGPFGATMAAGKLRGLNAQQLYQAMGICANLLPTASGASAFQGSMVKSLGCGWAAALGVYAAHLAENGLTGIDDFMKHVFANFIDSIDPSLLTRELGKRFEMQELGMKWVAAGPLRSELECAFNLREKYSINPADIEDIHIKTNGRTAQLCASLTPPNLLACKFSAPYCVAQVFLGLPREAFLDEVFTEKSYNNPAWREIGKRMHLTADDEYSKAFETYPNTNRPSTMTVRMKDGKVYEESAAQAKGNLPSHRPPPSDYVTKFRRIVTPRLGEAKATAIIGKVEQLEQLAGVRELLEACR